MFLRSFKKWSVNRIANILFATAIIAGLILSLASVESYRLIISADDRWQNYRTTNGERVRAVGAVIGALGYGGMIHQFKNYVIRGDEKYKRSSRLRAGAALEALERFEALGATRVEKRAIEQIRGVINKHLLRLEDIEDLIAQGRSTSDIDWLVRVNDDPAITGLETLLETSADYKTHETKHTKHDLLGELKKSLGFGRMIHHFKNYVIRQDYTRVSLIKSDLNKARAVIADYQLLQVSHSEKRALADIVGVVNAYEAGVSQALELVQAGAKTEQIDAEIKIDDEPAFDGLAKLDAAVAADKLKAEKSLTSDLMLAEQITIAIAAFTAFLSTALALVIYIVMKQGISRPAQRIAGELDRLAAGDLDVDVKDLEADTEIGAIARAATIFRNNLVENRRLAQEATEHNAELERLRLMAEHDSLHDPLTGLANRRYLEREMEERQAGGRDSLFGMGVLHIDLDRFKQINDTLGHAAGDYVLTHVAGVLRESTRSDDFICRFGGDEFVVLTDSDGNRRSLEALATRIIEELSQPVFFNDEACHFGASIGIDVGTGRRVDPRRLLVNADIALYYAKESGRGQYAFFNPSLRGEVERARVLSDDILLAVAREEFFPVYQPQVDASTHKLKGVEVLARWRHPDKGEISPAVFLPVADKLGITPAIDHMILCKALEDLATWDAAGFYVPRISVNVSAKRLRDKNLIASLAALDIPKGRLSFEILETVFADTINDTMRYTLDNLIDAGIDIEIDDFGTGHASLLSLLSLAPTRAKIAREFVSELPGSKWHLKLVRYIVELAHSLNIEVIAEGVETLEQAEALRKLGCGRLQGYAFSKPIPADVLRDSVLEKAARQRPVVAA